MIDRLFLFLAQCLYPHDDLRSYCTKYSAQPRTLLAMAFMQKILGFNRSVPYPVHFTSIVCRPERIERQKGHGTLGWMPGCYVQAGNGIRVGVNVLCGPGAKIVSANHNPDNIFTYVPGPPIIIEDGCWIGANAIILAGVHLGKNTVVGAGSVVTKCFEEGNCVIAGNPAKLIRRLSVAGTVRNGHGN
jgi:hypothetical protein